MYGTGQVPETNSGRTMPIQFTQQSGSISFAVKVVPGASKDRIVGEYAGGLKVTVSKPPEGGAANRAVIELLAAVLGVPKSHVEIIRGQSDARKTVRVRGLTVEQMREVLG
jgi:uncharacterized protein